MTDQTTQLILALIGTIPSLLGLIGIIISIRVSQKNHAAITKQGVVIDKVQSQTDGLMAKMSAAAEAKGVETGHAAGVAQGVAAGAQEERDHPTQPSA